MKESFDELESQLDDEEFRHAYASSFMNAEKIGTKQAGISRLENVNYDAWKVETLARIASAFDVWLRISFEEFDSLTDEIDRYGRATLERESYKQVKKRLARKRQAEPVSEKLLEALSPADHVKLDTKKEIENASQVSATGEGLCVSPTRGNDSRNELVPSKSSGLSGREVPFSKETRVA
jgi:t-SNARE complex subunit (syntaxin)